MKHSIKITLILISMFIITQMIGLFVISVYNNPQTIVQLPYGVQPPAELQNQPATFQTTQLLISFVIALSIFILLIKIKAENFIRLWFFLVIILALGLAINSVLTKFNVPYSQIIAILIALPLSYLKIFKRDIRVHNITELFIYPGIAAVFVPILNIRATIIILFLISLYDIWAVWHTSFMKNMAKYQINELKIFGGFFIPYADKKQKEKIRYIKEKYSNKSEKFLESKFKQAKIKVQLAILGGGDIVFPIITAGVFYKFYHSLLAASIISLSATLSLLFLFILARKGKFYPAMPFLTIGMYLGMIISWLVMMI